MTVGSAALAPLTKTVVVPCALDRAFELFTSQINAWWPLRTHSVGEDASEQVEMQCRVGGEIVETLADGTTAVWGTLSEWAPPHRVRFSWHPGQLPAEATQVDVAFESDGSSTRVTLVHSGWQGRLDGTTARHGYDTGWDLVLGGYTAALAS